MPPHASSEQKLDVSTWMSMPDMPGHANLSLHASSGHKLDNSCIRAYMRCCCRCQYAATCQLWAKAGCQPMLEYARYAGTCQSAATCQLSPQIGQQFHGSLCEIWPQMSICRHIPDLHGQKLDPSECLSMPDMAAHANLQVHASAGHPSPLEIWRQMPICRHMPALGKSWMPKNA